MPLASFEDANRWLAKHKLYFESDDDAAQESTKSDSIIKADLSSSFATHVSNWDISGFFFSSRRRHTRCYRDWSSDVCSSDLMIRHTRCYRDWSSDVCSSD